MSDRVSDSVNNETIDQEPVFKTVTVNAEHAGKRLDRFLVDTVPDLSRAKVRTLLDSGQVLVNGKHPKKGDAVEEGSEVQILQPPAPKDFSPIAATTSLDDAKVGIVFSNDHVVVFAKPAAMPTHPLRPEETNTLANYVIAKFPETKDVGFAKREPGLLHRLDTDTSGLVMVARSANAFESLRTAMKSNKVSKYYQALVSGEVIAEGRVDYPLVPHRKDPKRVEAVTPHVRLRAGTKTYEAQTIYRPVKTLVWQDEPLTLIEVEVRTAFRHQVRVHLATVGHPLVGDVLYRGMNPSSLGLSRHFLHASKLVFPDPGSSVGKPVTVESPLPEDLKRVVEQFGSAKNSKKQ